MPIYEPDVATIRKWRRTSSGTFFLTAHEEMHRNSSTRMLANTPAVFALLTRAVLTLPLEFSAIEEMVFLLELLRMPCLIKRCEKKQVARPFDETGIPNRSRELETPKLWDLLS